MPSARAGAPATRIGLIVNPVAGLGGSVGLKGSDGAEVVARARQLGAEPRAMARAATALERLAAAWSPTQPHPELVCGPGDMGQSAAAMAGWPAAVAGTAEAVTSAADTRRLARDMAEHGADLLLFAGGDGTARDVHAALGDALPVLGIPAGVKIQSAVFATSPGAAGEVAARYLSGRRQLAEREVLDLDEDAYRRGLVRPRLYGAMRVPVGPLLQSAKAPTPAGDVAASASIAAEVEALLEPGRRYVLGPGTTTRAVAQRLGIDTTLVGVDGFVAETGGVRLEVEDGTEAELYRFVSQGPASIVLTPIGGQGFLFGRGNQPISPTVIRTVGLAHIVVLATPAKLAALGGRPLLVDSGDAALDQELCGYRRVITGRGDRAVIRIEEA